MAMKTVIPFPIFAPIPKTTVSTTTTEIRFSRWNNANAEKFIQTRRTQHQIEDDLRRFRRFESALNIANIYDSATTTTTTTTQNPNFKSSGTPSTPSPRSIPGKKSKYSKEENPNSHPAFRKQQKRSKFPQNETLCREVKETDVKIGKTGMSYVVPGAPFEFMYSYTETPKVKPIGLREAPVAPFGPGTMPRPWTGRKPFPPSKKKVPELDSFVLPPANKKGVKPIQKPGPFLPGSGPRYVMTREEILGEPLMNEEVKELVEGCRKTKRQLNMGRDGLTHNMLDNIHAHWKRRRVCKIKCKGVCTVDMDNVCQQLEEKTGGKIIYHRGGIVYLFRGRNYNYKNRPRFPLMLWKPITPVYPRLVQRVPEGLTLEEATDMRKRGRQLIPICKLGKNGVYTNLVKNIREAFEACELVRIDCQGMNPSDYRRIGAKLKDLVPCVLISFENEHVLMWRGRDWKSSLVPHEDDGKDAKSSETDVGHPLASEDEGEDEGESASCSSNITIPRTSIEMPNLSTTFSDDLDVDVNEIEVNGAIPTNASVQESETKSNSNSFDDNEIKSTGYTCEQETRLVDDFSGEEKPTSSSIKCTEGVLVLLRQAVESGSAVILDEASLDADVVYERSVAFAQIAPPGPVFRLRPKKIAIQKSEEQEVGNLEVKEAVIIPVSEKKSNEKKPKERKNSRSYRAKDLIDYLDVVPQGSLKIDELAKLLA